MKKPQPAHLLLQLYGHLEVPSKRLSAAAGSRLSLRADIDEARGGVSAPAPYLLFQLYGHNDGAKPSLRADMNENRGEDSCRCKPARGALAKRPCLTEDIHGCKCKD